MFSVHTSIHFCYHPLLTPCKAELPRFLHSCWMSCLPQRSGLVIFFLVPPWKELCHLQTRSQVVSTEVETQDGGISGIPVMLLLTKSVTISFLLCDLDVQWWNLFSLMILRTWGKDQQLWIISLTSCFTLSCSSIAGFTPDCPARVSLFVCC